MRRAGLPLRQFVRETLVEITNGIADAQVALRPTGVRINPHTVEGDVPKGGAKRMVEQVAFDIAVSTTGAAEGSGSIGVVSAGFAAKLGLTYKKEHVSRVQFAVPVIWPVAEQARTSPDPSQSSGAG